MTTSALSKNACSKPSCISISSTANPMPPAERSSRDLLEARLRQASGTEPGRPVPASPVVEWGTGEEAVVRTLLFQNTSSEHVGGGGAAQSTGGEQRRNQRHDDRGGEHGNKAHFAHRHRQQCLLAD